MKNLTTLAFLFFTVFSFGQKALSGSVLVQDNGQDLHFTSTLGSGIRTEWVHDVLRVPSFAVAYFNFREPGNYTKWQLSGWRFDKITDLEKVYDDSTGLNETSAGGDLILASGSIGFAKSWLTMITSKKLSLILEGAINTGWQYTEYRPRTSQQFTRTFIGTSTQFGPNVVLHKNFEQGFLRVALLAPLFQFSTEYNRNQNPTLTASQNTISTIGFDISLWKRTGLEIGGGLFFGK